MHNSQKTKYSIPCRFWVCFFSPLPFVLIYTKNYTLISTGITYVSISVFRVFCHHIAFGEHFYV